LEHLFAIISVTVTVAVNENTTYDFYYAFYQVFVPLVVEFRRSCLGTWVRQTFNQFVQFHASLS
jgi:hypothetical protein